jgi:Holliday junction resolvase
MTGGRASRAKGNRAERAIVRLLQERGFAAERVPLSGAARGRFGGDVSVPLLGIDRRVEVKCRGNGFRQLYAWLDGVDFLIVRADRREPLAVLPLKLAAEIAAIAEGNRSTAMNGNDENLGAEASAPKRRGRKLTRESVCT